MTYMAQNFDADGDYLGVTYSVVYECTECGTDWDNLTAADECATIDAAESKQIRAAEKKRKPWDSGIIRGYD